MLLTRQRVNNAHNSFQQFDQFKRTLCVCSAGLLRSPTLAWVLSNEPYSRNTRAAGSHAAYALIPIDEVLLSWADEIVFVNEENHSRVKQGFDLSQKKVVVLAVPDKYPYRHPELIDAIQKQLAEAKFS